jgi:hypothetical protein
VIAFLVALVATLAALGGAIWAGVTRRRSAHYALVTAMFVLLGLTIWRARVWGSGLIFDGASGSVQIVHRAAVVATFAIVPLLVWTGVRLARARGEAAVAPRAGHRRAAVWFIVALVAAAALGTLMTVLARRA